MIEVDHIPVVDVHAHPFLNRGAVTAEEFTDLTAFGGGSREYMEEGGLAWSDDVLEELQRGKRNTLYFKRMILDVAKLYGDVNLETLIFDFGIPLPMLDVAAVRSELPVEVVPIFRIEPLIADLLKTDIGWSEFQRRYDDA